MPNISKAAPDFFSFFTKWRYLSLSLSHSAILLHSSNFPFFRINATYVYKVKGTVVERVASDAASIRLSGPPKMDLRPFADAASLRSSRFSSGHPATTPSAPKPREREAAVAGHGSATCSSKMEEGNPPAVTHLRPRAELRPNRPLLLPDRSRLFIRRPIFARVFHPRYPRRTARSHGSDVTTHTEKPKLRRARAGKHH